MTKYIKVKEHTRRISEKKKKRTKARSKEPTFRTDVMDGIPSIFSRR